MKQMIFRMFVVLSLVCVNYAGVLNAESLDDCYNAALKQSEIMADQSELVAQAEEQARQAFSGMLTAFWGFGSYAKQDQPVSTSAANAEQTLAKVSGSISLFRGFKDFAAIQQAGSIIQYQQEARRWAGLQLYADTAQVFFGVLALEADLGHLDKQLELYELRIKELRDRVRTGRSREAEIHATEAAQAILKAQRGQVYGQLHAGREVFVFLTGLTVETRLDPPLNLPEARDPVAAWVKQADQRPDLAAARRRIEVAKAGITAAQSGHWPSVDLGANYYLERSGTVPGPAWDTQIALTLPLFTGFATSSKVSQAESQARETELALQRLKRAAVQEVRTLYWNLQADTNQVEVLQQALDLSEKSYREVHADYNLGLVTNLEVLQALSSYHDTARSLDKVRFLAHTDYHRLIAVTAQKLKP